MKFSELPKFTRQGHYQVNMPLTYLLKWIKECEEDLHLQLNPDFQRGHVWTEKQQIAFVEYLFKGGKAQRTIYFNSPSWSGNVNESDYNEFVCVDGLQRITACQKFLNNEIPIFGYYYKDFTDKLPMSIDLLLNINDLKTKKEVLQWYIEMNENGTPHTLKEIEKVKSMLKEENNG